MNLRRMRDEARLINLSKALANEEVEALDSPEAIEETRKAFIRIANGHSPNPIPHKLREERNSSLVRPDVGDDIRMPWQFPKRKD
jgi:hypothetical protein